jgi:hypothetical protein
VASATIAATNFAEQAATSAAPNVRAATPTVEVAGSTTASSTARDRWRDWLWGFLAILALSQFYFVRELVAVFALFALAFVAVAVLIIGVYMLQKSSELAVARFITWRRPVLQISPVPHDHRKPA